MYFLGDPDYVPDMKPLPKPPVSLGKTQWRLERETDSDGQLNEKSWCRVVLLLDGGRPFFFFFFYYHSWTITKNDTKDDSDIEEQKKMDLWVQFIILMQMKFSIITTFCQT